LASDVAGHEVDERRLAGAVRSDEAEDGALFDIEGHPVDGVDAAEVSADISELQ
jgi:hypothetical protein